MKKSLFILSTLVLFLGLSKAAPRQGDMNQIIFLNLKLVNGHIYLEDFSVVKGRLKQPKRLSFFRDNIYCKVVDETDHPLYEAVITDPSAIRYEYEDDRGSLATKKVVLDSVNFTVRIPYDQSISRVEFYKIEDALDQSLTVSIQEKSMGSIIINLRGVTD